MNGMAETRGQHLCLPAIVLINLDDVLEQQQSVFADVIEASEKRTDKTSPGFCRQNSLRRGKTERHVNLDSFIIQDACGLQTGASQGTLDHNIGRNLRILSPFTQHTLSVLAGAFGGHRSLDDFTNRGDMLLEIYVALFGNQGRISSNAVR